MIPLRMIGAALLAGLAGCAETVNAPAARNVRYYQVDLTGVAAVCTVPAPMTLAGPAEAAMVVGNDGGWCGVTVAQAGPTPFASHLVATRPAHGRLNVRRVGEQTRVDYIPDAGFTGTDAFAVTLVPGPAALRVAVTVQANASPIQPAVAPARR